MMSPCLELAGTQGHQRLAPLGLASLALAWQVNLQVPLPSHQLTLSSLQVLLPSKPIFKFPAFS